MGCQPSIIKVHSLSPKQAIFKTLKGTKSKITVENDKQKQKTNTVQILKSQYFSRGSTSKNSNQGTIASLSPNKPTKNKNSRKKVSRMKSRPLPTNNDPYYLAESPRTYKSHPQLTHDLIKQKSRFFNFQKSKNIENQKDFQKMQEIDNKRAIKATSNSKRFLVSSKLPKLPRKLVQKNSYSPQLLDLKRLPPIFKPIRLAILTSPQ